MYQLISCTVILVIVAVQLILYLISLIDDCKSQIWPRILYNVVDAFQDSEVNLSRSTK